jgi:hypothetical protein
MCLNRRVLLLAFFLIFLCKPFGANASEVIVQDFPVINDEGLDTAPYPGLWEVVHGSTYGRYDNSREDALDVYTGALHSDTGWIAIYRSFISFDTRSIPADAKILSANLVLTPKNLQESVSDEYSYINVYPSFQSSSSEAVLDDIELCGSSLVNPNSFTEGVSVGDFTVDTPYEFILNDQGTDWIKRGGFTPFCLREGHDTVNSEIINNDFTAWKASGIIVHSSESANEGYRPYLKVVYQITSEDESKYPLYTQKISPFPSVEETATWASDLYADGTSYCGSGNTIAYCGCAITSLVMAGRHAGITTDIVGKNVDPGNMNEWLAAVGGYTTGGYLWWLAGQAYFGELSSGEFGKGGEIRSRFAEYDSASVDTKTFIDEALAAGDKVVLGYKDGHYVWITEKTENSYLLNDPSWYLTRTASDTKAVNVRNYGNTFNTAHTIKITDEPVLLTGGSIESYITGTAELLYEDALGNKVGYEDGSVVVDLDRSWYSQNIALSTEEDEVLSDVKHLLVQQTGGIATIEVVGVGVGSYEVEFFTISETGKVTTFSFTGLTFPGVTTTFSFDLETGEVIEQPISYEQFLLIMNSVLTGLTPQQRAFFEKWAEKMYADIEEKTVTQALQMIETFGKLLVAKKVESPTLLDVLEKLSVQVQVK